MTLTDVGEIGVRVGAEYHKLRPSLQAMTQIGTPAEIVAIYASVMTDVAHMDRFPDALSVVHACSDGDLSSVFGCYVPARAGSGIRFKPGKAEPAHIVPLARCLLKHGITGALPALPRKPGHEPEYVQEFDARAHVALAMAHLGMSSPEAWAMTMTELVGALRAKFPPQESSEPGAKAPTKEQHEATMEWFERVEAARVKRG